MQNTKIEYLDYSYNPLAMRCTPCSPACAHCWHLRLCNRLMLNPLIKDEQRAAYAGLRPPVMTHRLTDPLHVRKPSRIGVMFMGDLWHESVPFAYIDQVFAVMGRCRQHQFFVLTKRVQRMAEYFKADRCQRILNIAYSLKFRPEGMGPGISNPNNMNWWPHVYLGCTVWDQPSADENIPVLLSIPGKHWVSYEPALGPVDLPATPAGNILCRCEVCMRMVPHTRLDWVVSGSETGPGARPAHPDWFRKVRDDCVAAAVPYFHKSNGEWLLAPTSCDVRNVNGDFETLALGEAFIRIGKKLAGRLLDGREWNELPK